VLPFAFVLSEPFSNNIAEYQALIASPQMALDMKISYLEAYDDSKLVINQLLTHYEVKHEGLIPNFQMATRLIKKFDGVSLEHIPRNENRMANALANLATTLALLKGEKANVPICNRWVLSYMEEYASVTNTISISIMEDADWRQPLINYLEHGKLPEDPYHMTAVRQRAPHFIHYKGTLYRRSFDGLFLRCVGKKEGDQAMEKAHSGVCGAHRSGPKLYHQIKRMCYYWPTMVKDCIDYAKTCEACQLHANYIH